VKAKMTISLVSILVAAGLLAAGCGSGSSSDSTAGSTSSPSESETRPVETAQAGAAAPSEAQSAATGDIPDNQTFLLFHDPVAGYSIRYPEGWARKGAGNDVTFQEKANTIHVAVRKGASAGAKPVMKKTTFSRFSAPDPVTGKRLRIVVDRYEYRGPGKVAVLELATPVGVDNVDAYRMISESFKWQR
jgi:hypothetical protein